MICEKCGREFPDDMQKCLWCDHAPSVRPEPEIDEEVEEKIEVDADGNPLPHPVGKYMWSVGLGGPIVAWFFHRKELQRAECSFFWYMVACNICFVFVDRLIDSVFKAFVDASAFEVLVGFAWLVAWVACIAYLGAKRMKLAVPHYDTKLFRRRERWGVTVGVVVWLFYFVLCFLVGIYKGLAENGMLN